MNALSMSKLFLLKKTESVWWWLGGLVGEYLLYILNFEVIAYLPKRFYSFRVKKENLVKPMSNKFVSIKSSSFSFGNISGYALSSSLPVVPGF
jgi:hypothetical protein